MTGGIDLSHLSRVCDDIANAVAGPSGFVAMRDLATQFRAELLVRPLLVEGMIGTIANPDGSTRWAVLVDSEKYRVTGADVELETPQRRLPDRLRFTIAHELAHTLAFRPNEFNFQLAYSASDKQSKAAFVEAVETETDRLSSLLLWPRKALERFLSSEEPFSVGQLARIRKELGISRYALIHRLKTFQRDDERGLMSRKATQNSGIGLGQWVSGGQAVLRSGPLFYNFDRNILPAALLKARKRDRVSATEVFVDERLVVCGGRANEVEFEMAAGTDNVPESERMVVQVSVEATERRVGSSLLYVVRKAN
jgi:hypothetical protein